MSGQYYIRYEDDGNVMVKFSSMPWCLSRYIEHGGEIWDASSSPPKQLQIKYDEPVGYRHGIYFALCDGEVVGKKTVPCSRHAQEELASEVKDSGVSIVLIAKVLGIPSTTLGLWLRTQMSDFWAGKVREALVVALEIKSERDAEALAAREERLAWQKAQRVGNRKPGGSVASLWYAKSVMDSAAWWEECLSDDYKVDWSDGSVEKIIREVERYGTGW